MKVWYVAYETNLREPVFSHFACGFTEEEDAKAFLKRIEREKATCIRNGWCKFFIEERSRFK